MSKVKMGFSGLSVPEQIERGRLITGNMATNPTYPTPSPTLADVNDAIDATEVAYNESRGRDKEKIAILRLRRKAMLALILQLAGYVQQASGNDEEKILSSGFDVVAPKVPRPDTAGVVTNIRLSEGSNSGKIKVTWDAANYAVLYFLEFSPSADFVTTELKGMTTRTQKEIGDFTPGQRVWIRVLPLGRENPGPKSDAVSIIVK